MLKTDFRWWRATPVYFLAATVIFGLVAVYSLRQNNLHMITLRQAVYDTDNNNGDVEASLRSLREYVYAHMNTNLSSGGNSIKPPVQLKYRYERLLATQKQASTEASDSIYTQAQAYCEQQNSSAFSGRTRVPCIQEYVSSHGVAQKPIEDSLYKFDFISPTWSPDLAGLSIVVSIICLVGAVVTWQVGRRVQSRHNQHL